MSRKNDLRWHVNAKDRNHDSKVREAIYNPNFEFIEDAQEQLDMPVRDIQEKWGLSFEASREGKNAIMKLQPKDLELPPLPPPRKIVHKTPPKCVHGNWRTANDREKSSYCSACYPNGQADVVKWRSAKNDITIRDLYLLGVTLKVLAKRFRVPQRDIKTALRRTGTVLENRKRVPTAKVAEATPINPVIVPLPTDPQNPVRPDAA